MNPPKIYHGIRFVLARCSVSIFTLYEENEIVKLKYEKFSLKMQKSIELVYFVYNEPLVSLSFIVRYFDL